LGALVFIGGFEFFVCHLHDEGPVQARVMGFQSDLLAVKLHTPKDLSGLQFVEHFLESLMSSKTSSLSRRGLFSGAATVGAVAAVSAVLPGVVKQAVPTAVALPKPTRGGGYTLSEHVQHYYKTTRV
jgi:hypothetical protein